MNNVRSTARSITKPLMVFGVDRRTLGALVMVFAVMGTNGTWMSKWFAFLMFLVVAAWIRKQTAKDHRVFDVWRLAWDHKPRYTPYKTKPFKFEIIRRGIK